MHHRASSSAQRRPRLLRASMTEPSLFTSPTINHHASLDMSPVSFHHSSGSAARSGSSSPPHSSSPSSSYHRRATDLLNHVAYLSSCATSPVSSFISGTGTTSRSGRGSLSSSSSSGSSATRSHSIGGSGSSGTGTSSRATGHAAADSCYRRAEADEVFGSSPASTHTSSSIEDLQSRYPGSANYYSFPSFDTWDPDCEKEDDIDG